MIHLHTLTLIGLLSLCTTVDAQEAEANFDRRPDPPLNLSIPRGVQAGTGGMRWRDDDMERNLRNETSNQAISGRAGSMPYGSGYEARESAFGMAGRGGGRAGHAMGRRR